MDKGQWFLLGVIVGAVGSHYAKKKLRKTIIDTPKEKAKGVVDKVSETVRGTFRDLFGKKEDKK